MKVNLQIKSVNSDLKVAKYTRTQLYCATTVFIPVKLNNERNKRSKKNAFSFWFSTIEDGQRLIFLPFLNTWCNGSLYKKSSITMQFYNFITLYEGCLIKSWFFSEVHCGCYNTFEWVLKVRWKVNGEVVILAPMCPVLFLWSLSHAQSNNYHCF